MRQFFTSMSYRSRIAFAAGLLGILLLVGGVTWWVLHPPYAVLFGDLRESDAAEITSALGQMQEPFRLADEGKTILVPADDVYGTRMKLVSQGVPKGGSVGFELFKDSDYGVTEFAQRVNFQRALQGELERTIDSLTEVASSRVHLTIHRAGLFERDQEASKASVTLSLRPMKQMEAKDVVGIQRLVASAVEDLAADSVVVLDDKGTVLSGHGSGGLAGQGVGDHLDDQTQLEAKLRARVSELLRHVLPSGEFTVSVNVTLNYDRVKRISDHLLAQGKDGNGLLVRQKVDETAHVDSSDPDHVKSAPGSNDQELEYAHGHEQEEVERAPGRIEQISVGILVPATVSSAELAKLSAVVSAGLGLDPTRGDKIDIAAVAVRDVAASPVAPSHATAATSAADSSDDADATATEGHAAAAFMPPGIWPYVGLAALLVLLVAGVLIGATRSRPRRLLASEREGTLAQLRQWIESTETEVER